MIHSVPDLIIGLILSLPISIVISIFFDRRTRVKFAADLHYLEQKSMETIEKVKADAQASKEFSDDLAKVFVNAKNNLSVRQKLDVKANLSVDHKKSSF